MEAFLFACMLVVLVIRWIYLRNRLDALENRLFVLELASVNRAPAPPSPMPAPLPICAPSSISALSWTPLIASP